MASTAKVGGVGGVADRHPALVVGEVVDPVGDGLAQSLCRRSRGSWPGSGSPAGCYSLPPLENSPTSSFFFVSTLITGSSAWRRPLPGVVQVAELGVSVGVGGALLLLGRRLEAVAQLVQDPPHRSSETRKPWRTRSSGQVVGRLGRPAQRTTSGCHGSRDGPARRGLRAGRAACRALLSPPPTRWRSVTSMPASTSRSALITVLRPCPEASATLVFPPRPSIAQSRPPRPDADLVQMRQHRREEPRELLDGHLHAFTLRELSCGGP